MQSKNTFSEELSSIGQIPGVMYKSPDGREPETRDPFAVLDRYHGRGQAEVENPVATWGGHTDTIAPEGVENTEFDLGIISQVRVGAMGEQTLAGWLEGTLDLDIERIVQEVVESEHERSRVAAAVATFGAEALGCYLPWHYFANSKRTPWGIYLHVENILAWAGVLLEAAKRMGIVVAPRVAMQMSAWIAFRHELFHFHVERFAIRQEVLQRKPVYLPYDREVFQRTAGSERWLEEALAMAVILDSTLVAKGTGLSKRDLGIILRDQFRTFPPGYRDYECKNFGGPAEAHKLLAAQIAVQKEIAGFSSTEFATPKREYGTSHRSVPGYVTLRPAFRARFQFSTPKTRDFERWAERHGFSPLGGGPGDHKRWRYNATGEVVQVNPVGKEIDMASHKAVARVVGLNAYELRERIAEG